MVTADGEFDGQAEDIVYVGQGTTSRRRRRGREFLHGLGAARTGRYPTTLVRRDDAETVRGGRSRTTRDVRTIRKYVHDRGVASCEIAIGITTIEPGSMWNTMPCHTHDRRTEVYLYFDLPENERVMHICGRPEDTRSLVVANRQAVISPPWSVHSGAGTASYKFVWSTAGENLTYADMDPVATAELT